MDAFLKGLRGVNTILDKEYRRDKRNKKRECKYCYNLYYSKVGEEI